MDVDEVSAGSWTPGIVAEELGISPVTLRTWASRYGVGPSLRPDGRHRRYSDADVRKLQYMRRLIGRGIKPREAAAAVFSGSEDAVREISLDERADELERAAEALDFTVVAALLDETLDTMGAARTWTEILLPILRDLGVRWSRGDMCFESEWALTSEVSYALQRYVARFAYTPSDRRVLIACCPAERHSLPVEVLRASMAEVGIPAVYLGHMVPAETTAGMVAKLEPVLVVLWSMSPTTVDNLLRQRLQRRGFDVAVAGPGWDGLNVRGAPWVNDLAGAMDLAAERMKT